MATEERNCAKDFHQLLRNVHGMSGGQVEVTDWEDDLSNINLTVTPSDGLYKGGQFLFTIRPSTNDTPPRAYCKTMIYHPNIDTIEDCGEICLNLFEDSMWTSHMGLEDAVQGILFLFYNPNLEDPLTCIFSPDMLPEDYEANVKLSLEGREVEGYIFPKNRVGLVTKLEVKGDNGCEENEVKQSQDFEEVGTGVEEMCVDVKAVDVEHLWETNNNEDKNTVVNRIIAENNKENEILNRVDIACKIIEEDEGKPVDGYQVQSTGDTKVKNVINKNTIVRYECASPNCVNFLKGAGGKVVPSRFHLWWRLAISRLRSTWECFLMMFINSFI